MVEQAEVSELHDSVEEKMLVEAIESSKLIDKRVECWSLMTALTTGDYINLASNAYHARGGIDHQRVALKTTTGKRIRERMISDIKSGAILPPVVLGVVVSDEVFKAVAELSPGQALELISNKFVDMVSIIDGMQRTTALMAANEEDPGNVSHLPIRIECWVAKSTDSLIYRMLVLNTGQVPWNLSRQLQVVYAPLVAEMKSRTNFVRVLDMDKAERRAKGGEYPPDSLVELYIAFGLRKTDIDTQESLADEFSRLDVTEALAERRYNDFFYPVLQMMVDIDRAFSRLDGEIEEQASSGNGEEAESKSLKVLKRGKSIFDSKPARIGFVVAVSVAILGRLGMDRETNASNATLAKIQSQVATFVERLNAMNVSQMLDFLKLEVLSEVLYSSKRSAVGRYERAFFDTAFKTLIDVDFQVPSMLPCWRAS